MMKTMSIVFGSAVMSSAIAFADGGSTASGYDPTSGESLVTSAPASALDDVGRDVKVKNQSNRVACVAIVEANPLRARGWYVLQNASEQTFFNIAYIHAEECGQTGVKWQPAWDLRFFCLKQGSAFDYFTPDNTGMCSSLGGEMAQYFRTPTGLGTYDWTLNF